MAHLELSGVSADGRRLLLASEEGEAFTLDITPALRTALRTGPRGDTPPRTEPTMSSTLRPRDIQDRIRSGETPEAVASAAGTTVEAIMSFVAPVLAERDHVAQRAQRSSVRRTAGEGGAPQARVLEDSVAAHLRSQDTRPHTVEWDAFRREDGKWTLTAAYDAPRRSGTAHFTFDVPGNYVTADDDDARWLVGDLVTPAEAPAARDDLQHVRQRRLAAVGSDELPFADDALDLVGADTEPLAPEPDPVPGPPAVPAEPTAEAPQDEGDQHDDQHDDPAKQRRPIHKKRGRASVPSWDEIMFGGGDQ